MSSVLSSRQIWGAPLALGLLSAVGLVAALVADGLGDAVSWVALSTPIAASVYGWSRAKRPSAPPPVSPPVRKTRPTAKPAIEQRGAPRA